MAGLHLYELSEAYRAAVDAAEDAAEQGDELVFDALMEALGTIDGAVTEKVDAIGAMVREAEAEAKVFAEEARRLHARRQAAENRADGLKRYLHECLRDMGLTKVKGERFTASVQANSQPSVQVAEGAEQALVDAGYAWAQVAVVTTDRHAAATLAELAGKVPGATVETSYRPDTAAIREAWKAGDGALPAELDGLVTCERGEHLRLR